MEVLFIPAGCDPAIVEKASEARNYLDADSPEKAAAMSVAQAHSSRGSGSATSVFRLRGAERFPPVPHTR
jgi:hypothetical protein